MTTWKTVTVDTSGADYTTLHAALAGEKTDVTAQVGDLIVLLKNFSDTTAVTTAGQAWTTDATHRVLINVEDAHDLKWTTGAYRLEVTGTPFINSTIDHLVVTGIQIREHGTFNGAHCVQFQVGLEAGAQEFRDFIFLMDHQDNADNVTCLEINDSSPLYLFSNGIIYGDKSGVNNIAGIKLASSSPNVYCDNVLIDSVHAALHLDSANFRFRNGRITNCSNPVAGTSQLHSSSRNNLTDDSAPTNWGTDSIDSGDSPTIAYVDGANATYKSRDYKLTGASDSGYGAGLDLSGDSNNPFSTDGAGTTRTVPWDIGPHESSVSGTPVLSIYHWILRADDGAEAAGGASLLASEDTSISISASGAVDVDLNFRIRLGLDENNSGNPDTGAIQLRAKLNGGAAFDVDGSSNNVRMSASSEFADGAATTDHALTAPAGSFVAGEILETDGLSSSIDLAQDSYTIIEACIQARSADLANGDTLEFGLRIGGIDYFIGSVMATAGPVKPASVVAGAVTGTTIALAWTDPNSPDVLIRPYYKANADSEWIPEGTLPAGTVDHIFGNLVALSVGVSYDVGVSAFDDPEESIIVFDTKTTIAADRKLHITAFELEAENAAREAHVTAFELEAEPAAREAHVTAFEMQTYDAGQGDPASTGRNGMGLGLWGLGI